MIFYGTKGSHLHSEKVSGVKCINCGEQHVHTISVYGKYAYIYWIPIFPLSKKVFSECTNCKATLEKKEMSEQLRLKADNVKANTKTPLTYWTGLAVIVGIIVFSVFSSNKHKKDIVTYIAAPQKGDVIDYKPSDWYSTLKVKEVTNDSVFLVTNKMEISKQRRLYKIDKPENYTDTAYAISKEEYKKSFENGTFLDVER